VRDPIRQNYLPKGKLIMSRFIKLLTVMLILFTARVGLAQANISLPTDYWDFLYSGTASGGHGRRLLRPQIRAAANNRDRS
jgi:hypothetical protein